MDAVMLVFVGGFLTLLVCWGRRRFAAFPAQTPGDYDDIGPEFDIRTHLSGPLQCEGVIYGPFGRVTSRFTVDMDGTWDGDTGTLAETFRYDDGSVQKRAWHLTVGEDGHFTALADDVNGAGRGRQMGPTVQLLYQIRLAEDAGGHVLRVVDWMYLVGEKTIINRSQFRKFGIKVAELVATIRPKDMS
ncbi:DUF3833 domain-containing protein [Oceaniglobus ichthyenteri]|uniref:DUF3833 domain-containing protein n=1 Tax=Oceaniglobus ichthyenteri TaxID=2136177 RepID=UPI000D381BE3|nr:DUF3833 domain-containing protein [Oceaniglobus ichthyenteri]